MTSSRPPYLLLQIRIPERADPSLYRRREQEVLKGLGARIVDPAHLLTTIATMILWKLESAVTSGSRLSGDCRFNRTNGGTPHSV